MVLSRRSTFAVLAVGVVLGAYWLNQSSAETRILALLRTVLEALRWQGGVAPDYESKLRAVLTRALQEDASVAIADFPAPIQGAANIAQLAASIVDGLSAAYVELEETDVHVG